ncbi:MFS transporter [Spiractinospora alimapuensis]|uniref:Cmx/CmrA family chloramphenicol efflux MFS transporter n=1 Tax=Spiractinospora alimapuensis TaxID=2820884 RepID=UPI001F3BD03B|nr:Cmx/CmrA family chloramphenicol efflux MFS transporter [Spiractinospora alimapuensis]QVQ54470.1 MFS transporter [Spiractinospora alimapuensis]
MPLALTLLAVAVFAMSTSEFMLAGLLPDIATDLDVSVGAAGLLTSAYAVGMVLGAPLMAGIARRWPARGGLLGFVLVFSAVHVVGALTASFSVLLITRVVAALANAGFLAVALATAATLVAPNQKGRALAVLLAGTTVAIVAGVPGGAVLGTLVDWRATFWAIVMLCLPAALGVVWGIPARPGAEGHDHPTVSLRGELRQLLNPRLVLVMVVAALVNGATFATFTFLAPIVTDTAGLAELWVPAVLVLFGVGSFLGVRIAGRLSDQRPGELIAIGGPLVLVGWIALAVLAAHPIVLLVLVFTQGVLSFALGSTLIARVIYTAAGAPTMGGAYATAALNLGAVGGPVVAGASLHAGLGAPGPVWASGLLLAIALAVALPLLGVIAPRTEASRRVDRSAA